MRIQVAILAAGLGTRLGGSVPKPLTPLSNGRTILEHQVASLRAVFTDPQIYVVVGYKMTSIIEAQPDVVFVYNELFDQTNTSKSLLRALRCSANGGMLWMNGDVIFEPAALERLVEPIGAEQSFVVVNSAAVGEEEVKYTVAADGSIEKLSKQLTDGLGEAIGINYVSADDKPVLISWLDRVDATDYFERGMELAIANDGLRFRAIDISDLFALEVDFVEDLSRANTYLRRQVSDD